MKKIKDLLKTMGASDELANQICEEFERFDKQIHEKYDGVYQTKLGQAKKVCLEEVNKYKVDLAKKVRVFLEGKSGQIEKRLDQQRAIDEAEAMAKLRKVKELTESIEVADNAELQALRSKIKKLEEKTVQLEESKKNAVAAANRANQIALEVMERSNKQSINEGTKKPEPKTEGAKKKVQTEDKEQKKQKAKVLKEEINKKKQKASKPKTTNRTLNESQNLKPAGKSKTIAADQDILSIAEQI